jgi:hypothetical protein
MLLAVAGCAASTGGVDPVAVPKSSASATVRFTVKIPVVSGAYARSHNRPLYVASTTTSISVTIRTQGSGVTVLSQNFAVTSTSAGCSTSASLTTCTESLALAPGAYTASIATYDTSGNVLSEAQQVAFTAQLGVANVIALTLYGVPAEIVITPSTQTYSGSQSGGFTVYGSQAQGFTIAALDADGNTIVGPGLPSWSVAAASGSGFALTQPASGGTAFTITPSGNATESFTVTASFTDASVCTQSDAICETTFGATREQLLFFCATTLQELAPPYTGTPVSISGTTCAATDTGRLATDYRGDVFDLVSGVLYVAEPPYTSVVRLAVRAAGNTALAVDASGNAILCGDGESLIEVQPPYSAQTTLSTTCGDGPNLAIAGETLFAASRMTVVDVNVLVSPYASPEAQFSPGNDGAGTQGLAVDDAGDVAVAAPDAKEVSVIGAPSYASEVVMEASPAAEVVSLDHTGNLFASDEASGIEEYAAPFTASSTPSATFTPPLEGLVRMRFDASENLFIAAYEGSSIGIYELPPPYTASPQPLYTGGTVYEMVLTP